MRIKIWEVISNQQTDSVLTRTCPQGTKSGSNLCALVVLSKLNKPDFRSKSKLYHNQQKTLISSESNEIVKNK